MNNRHSQHLVIWFFVGLMLSTSSGCSLFVMAGKSLLGDPVLEAPFTKASGVDLTTGQHRVVIVASVPETIKSEFPAANVDLIEKMSRKLKAEGVEVINYNKVATWLDDNGGYWDDINELANSFETEFIIHIDVDSLQLKQPNTPDMYDGRVTGTIYGYEVHDGRNEKVAHRIFNHGFDRQYPDGYPQLADRMSRAEFHRNLMNNVSLALTHALYNHHASEEVY